MVEAQWHIIIETFYKESFYNARVVERVIFLGFEIAVKTEISWQIYFCKKRKTRIKKVLGCLGFISGVDMKNMHLTVHVSPKYL